MIKNIIYILGSVLIFFIGVIVYGMILNSREIPIDEAMAEKNLKKLTNVRLIVHRMNYEMDLYSDTILVKSYKAVFGRNSSNVKTGATDFATPRGKYFICRIDTQTKYYKCFRLNYPNESDAAEAFKKKEITQKEYLKIVHSLNKNGCPPQTTYLGGRIGIHGIGKYNFIFKNLPFVFNWTNGSIAISNDDIDELYKFVKIGTPVLIKD
jgi:murein L,D-transpeptidase YafK